MRCAHKAGRNRGHVITIYPRRRRRVRPTAANATVANPVETMASVDGSGTSLTGTSEIVSAPPEKKLIVTGAPFWSTFRWNRTAGGPTEYRLGLSPASPS